MCPPTQNEGKVRRWQLSKLTRIYVQREALYNIDHLACVKILVAFSSLERLNRQILFYLLDFYQLIPV